MKIGNSTGIVLLVVVGVLAFSGASSATAETTSLCENNTKTETPTEEECKPVSELHFLTVEKEGSKDGKTTLLSSLTSVECDGLVIAKKPSSVGDSLVFEEATLSYSGCNCEVSVLKQGTISVLRTGAELANVTASGFVVKVNCFELFTCDYDTTGLVGHGLGAAVSGTGGKGHVTYTKSKVNLREDLLNPFGACPKESTLDALYQSLTPFYIRSISKETTSLCENNTKTETPTEEECKPVSELHFLTVEKEGSKDGKTTLLSSLTSVECDGLVIAKKPSSVGDSLVFEEATLSYSGCNCEVSVLKQGTISVLRTGAELANVTASGFVVKVNCFELFTCDYDTTGLVGHGLGAAVSGTGGKGHVTYTKSKVNLREDLLNPFGACPKESTLDALYQSLTPFYIRSISKETTSLCENNTKTETPTEEECKPVSELHFLTVEKEGSKDGKTTLLSSLTSVECDGLVIAKKPSSVGDSLVFEEATLSYSGCNCEVSVLKQGTISVLRTGAELANVTASGFVVKVNCFELFTCDYDTTGLVGHGLGAAVSGTGGKGHVTYSKNKVNLREDLFSPFGSCPATSTSDALYQALTPFYIRA